MALPSDPSKLVMGSYHPMMFYNSKQHATPWPFQDNTEEFDTPVAFFGLYT